MHAQLESFYKQLYTHTQTFSVALSEFWLLFSAPAKGIMFYDVPISYVKEEFRFRCELEPFKHLPREASAHLAPLLLSGFHAEG